MAHPCDPIARRRGKAKGNNDASKRANARKVPGVLRCAYADIASLEKMVTRVCADAGILPPTLRREGDDRTYSDSLLRGTLCAIHARAPRLPSHAASFEHASSLEEVHARALAAHFKTHSAPNNVLCYGVRRKRAPSRRDPPAPDRGTPGGANIPSRADLEVVTASAATKSLLGARAWRTFHERVGDALMTHLLVHGSVFVPSGALTRHSLAAAKHGSHLQLCGAPVSAVGASRAAAMARSKRAAAEVARVERTTPEARKRKREKRRRIEDGRIGEEKEATTGSKRRRKQTFEPESADSGRGWDVLGTQSQESQPEPDDSQCERADAHSQESPAVVMLRRVGGFVANVIRTANPFMSPSSKAAPADAADDRPGEPRRGTGIRTGPRRRRRRRRKTKEKERRGDAEMMNENEADVVAESEPDQSGGSGEPKPQDATIGDARVRPSRLSSWRRKKLAKERAAAAVTTAAAEADADPAPKPPSQATTVGEEEEEEEEEDSFVPETPDVDVVASSPGDAANDVAWARLGAAAAAAGASSSDSVAMAWDRLGAMAASGDDDDAATPAKGSKEQRPRRGRVKVKLPGGAKSRAKRKPRRMKADPVRATVERPSEVVFDTSGFMHKSSYSRTPGLPRGHALNSVGRGAAGARRLYSVVFGKKPAAGGLKTKTGDRRTSASPLKQAKDQSTDGGRGRDKQTRRVPKRHRAALLPLLQTMIRKAKRCPYASILERHCPMPERVRGGEPAAEAKSLLASFTPPAAVASFLWSVVRNVAPREMLGGVKSRLALRRFLLRLVVLRRFEMCTLHEAMTGLKVSEFPWLFGRAGVADEKRTRRATRAGPASAALARRRDLQRWVRWLVADLVVPLLRSHFYCTETESHRLRVFYYRKGVWARLTAAHLAAMTEDPAGESRRPTSLGGTELPVTLDPARPTLEPAGETDEMDRDGWDSTDDADDPGAPAPRAAYRRLPKRRARLMLQRHLLGFSKLRLLPKSAGLRPVAMLGRPAVASFRSLRPSGGGKRGVAGAAAGGTKNGAAARDVLAFRPVNTSLQGVFDVLRHEAGARPGVMGANVSDYRDVHRRLGPFIRRWRATQRQLAGRKRKKTRGEVGDRAKRTGDDAPIAGPEPVTRPPYIVAADVKGAFDSIPLAALERVACELVGSGEYSVSRLARVVGGAAVGVRTKTQRIATPVAKPGAPTLDEPGNERSKPRKGSKRERKVGGVVIDLANPIAVHKNQVLELLREHLRRNVVRSGGVYLLQTTGIPQGSVLSTLLCAVFYAHLEQTHGLRGKSPSDDTSQKVLCRWTDDLLHVSFDRDPADSFLSAALEGFAEYGCEVNTGKTSLNFEYSPGGAEPTRIATRSAAANKAEPKPPMIPRRETVIGHGPNARRCIAWCGLLIDSNNLEVLVDYTRYAGDWAREAVTVPGRVGSGLKTPSPFSRLDRRVVAYLRPKCTALLYDHSVNSPLTARLNVYQSFLLAAIKTHCFVAAASEHPSARNSIGDNKGKAKTRGPSPAAVHAAITAGIRYMEGAVRHHMAVARATLGATGRIQRTHVRYLGLHAFAKIFSRKQSRHAETLALLQRDIGAATMRVAARRLATVVDDELSTTFDQIRF